MNNAHFDQIKYVHKLEAAGVSRAQAEVQAETFYSFIYDHMATKQDVLKSSNDLRSDMQILKRDLKIWFGGMLATMIIVMSAIMTVIVHVK